MANITFIVDTGCQFSGISGLIDSFNIANHWHARNTGAWSEPIFTTRILSQDGKAVKVSGGFQIMSEGAFHDSQPSDIVVVPSFLPSAELLPANAAPLLDWIVARYDEGVTIASICTGSFILAETGLLDGRQATTHWSYTKLFKRRYPKVLLKPDKILTRDKGLICSGSVSAYYYLALHLIEIFGSANLAAQCAKSFLVDPGKVSQSSYSIFNSQKGHGDQEILRAQEFIETSFAQVMSMKDLAKKVGISPRHFIRRFKKATDETPLSYLQQIRIEKAKDYLETTSETVTEISQVIGYENSGSFRKIFKESTGLSPSEYRSRFARGNGVESN
jgi:transcriptional regulator GlxA family with amidase domain